MKKIWSKLLSLVLATSIALPLAACGVDGETTDGFVEGMVNINIEFGRSGVQTGWFFDVEKRFEDATKDKVYGDDTGINIIWKDTTTSTTKDAETSGYNIFMNNGGNISKYARDGAIMDLTDLVNEVNPYDGKTIASKFTSNNASFVKNDRYYGLPWKEYFMGITHNIDLFEKYGWYFADVSNPPEGCERVPYKGNAGYDGKDAFFIAENGWAEKTAGVDGIKGTYDDGLPTSLEELMALCHKIKDQGGNWYPYACTGGIHEDYTNYLTEAILVGLEGPEKFGNYKDCDGEMEIVDGYENEKLWGLDDVYVPKTKTVTIDPNNKETWINISKSVARYYAIAFIQYLTKHTMICPCIRSNSTSNISVQESFIFSGTTMSIEHNSAMIMEGSYWYTEAEHNGSFGKWDSYMIGKKRPEMGIMPYPAAVNGHVEGVKTAMAYITSDSNIVINNNLMKDYDNNKYVIEACKEFIRFFYSDAEIANYIEATGQNRLKSTYDWQSLVYEKDADGNYKNGLNGTERVIKEDCKIPNYQISVMELERDSIIMDMEATSVNPTAFLAMHNVSGLMKPELGVFYSVFKQGTMTVREAFEATFIAAP